MSGVRLLLVDRLGSLPPEQRAPGMAKWARRESDPEGEATLLWACPCGCGDLSAVACSTAACSTAGRKQTADGSPCWSWNGSRDAPTLQPSLLRTRGCKWHGYLTDGVFRAV